MDNENFMEKVSTQLGQNATVKNVYGDPIQAGDTTIIPVARITYGFGGGYGQGNNHPKKPDGDPAAAARTEMHGEGAGGGGGLLAKPKGVYVVSPTGTRYIPATNWASIALGVVVGFLLRGALRRRRVR